MRRLLLGLLVLTLLAGAAILGLLWLVEREMHRPFTLAEPVLIEVPRGATMRKAARSLARAGLIRWPAALELQARLQGNAARLKHGEYRFKGTLSAAKILERITTGVSRRDVRVTLPEGLNRWEVAERLGQAGICSAHSFLAALGEGKEGLLFPDTYRFFPNSSPEKLIRTLTRRFDAVWANIKSRHPQGLREAHERGLGDAELITLASLVEKEARVEAERPLIARVLLNRLERGWKLQSDPTCVYGPDTYRKVPSPTLCRDPSNRYSTYVHAGLPPGPIANPGAASLRASLSPTRGPDAARLLYFVARRDCTGRHDFSRTAREHNAKVRRYLGGR